MRDRLRKFWPEFFSLPARLAALPVPIALRLWILRCLGHKFAPLARIRAGTLVLGGQLRLGRDTFVNGGCLIDAVTRVDIGAEVHISHRVQILTTDHAPGQPDRRAGTLVRRPVGIGDGCWVGAGAIILPGTEIGPGSVIAAGAVVHGEVPQDSLYGGVPAKLIRPLDPA